MKNSRILSGLLLLAIGNWQLAIGTPVVFPLSAMFGAGNYTKSFLVESVRPLITDGTNLYVGSFQNVTPTGGTNPIVKLTPNDYLVTFSDARVPWRIKVTNSASVCNALGLTSGTLPIFVYQPGVGGSATNVNNARGTNVALSGTFTDNSGNPIGGSGTATNLAGNALVQATNIAQTAATAATVGMLTNNQDGVITLGTSQAATIGQINVGDTFNGIWTYGGLRIGAGSGETRIKDNGNITFNNGAGSFSNGVFYGNGAGLTGVVAATSAQVVTGSQSNLLASALQAVPGNYLTTNGNGAGLTSLTAGNQIGRAHV